MVNAGTLRPNYPLVVVDSLSVNFEHRESSIAAIEEISFEVGAGEFVSICGPSGSGKTTLLRSIAGLCELTSGEIRIHDSVGRDGAHRFGYVVQDYSSSLFPWLTAFRNVELATRASKMNKSERQSSVEEALELVGLAKVGKKYPWELSGGMQQRVAIARALASGAQLLLMDEPFASIDAHTRFELEDLVKSIALARGTTVIMVTHDIDEAVYMSNRVLGMNGTPGKIVSDYSISFPFPRSQIAVRSDPRFVAVRNALYTDLQPARGDGESAATMAQELIGFLRKQKCQFAGGREEAEKFSAGETDIKLSRVIIDSLAAIELCIWIEDSWGIEINPDDLFVFESLGQLVEMAQNQVHGTDGR
ncbi:MAG: ATP-binding cassette domain-containing protein [Pontimonas sp.]|nr:ATP-binding cassette domain-containing protein [Pontimonas sp.]